MLCWKKVKRIASTNAKVMYQTGICIKSQCIFTLYYNGLSDCKVNLFNLNISILMMHRVIYRE